ncbi:MAG: TetR/AcrR family transcriptional regulator [Mycobacteriales bacterium]
MNQPAAGLRERKKERTRQALSETAIAMFLASGFDQVSVADIAAAAEVSKPTLFKYFPTKEDLVLHRIADHEDEAARTVATRRPGETPLAALRRHFLDGLARRDPVTGLSDHPAVLAFHRLLYTTPSLAARIPQFTGRAEAALAAALRDTTPTDPDDITPEVAAAQVIATQRVLALRTYHQIAAGHPADTLYPAARTAAHQAFDLLTTGLTPTYA